MSARLGSTEDRPGRSIVGTTALVAAAVSAIALLVLFIAITSDAKGFQSDSDVTTPLSYVVFLTWLVALVVSLITGAIAWFTGRRSARPGDVRAGKTAAGYLVVTIVVIVISSFVNR